MSRSARWFFAKVGPGDTVFDPSFARKDYVVMALALGGEEGQFDSLELVVKNPRTALLGGAIWLWWSYSLDGGPAVPLYFGRLLGIPRDAFEETITLQFVARPIDFGAQKAAIAAALNVLPYVDRVFLDEQASSDPDVMLAAYPFAWYFDRVTHQVGTAHVLLGEDSVLPLTRKGLLYDGYSSDLNQVPLTSVSVDAKLNWTQIATGEVDLTAIFTGAWPNEAAFGQHVITSFTLSENDWPKPLADLGDNWTVAASECVPLHELQPVTRTAGGVVRINWGDWSNLSGETGSTTTNSSISDQELKVVPPGSIALPAIYTDFNFQVTYTEPDPEEGGPPKISAINISENFTTSVIPLHHSRVSLIAGYDAERPRTERVRFTMIADVQPVLTLPGEDEALKLTLNSVSLNEPIDPTEDTDGELMAPIRDPRRRSYIVTERGRQSLEHLIALAQANLIRRSRAVELGCALTTEAALTLLPQITLRKNSPIPDPRLPEGTIGKIIAYRFALDGDSGAVDCTLTLGCAIGRGGEVTAVPGEPTYASADTMGPDVQEFIGRTVLFDLSVGYQPPAFNPQDDGIDFIAGVTAADAIEEAVTVENPPAAQRAALAARTNNFRLGGGIGPFTTPEQAKDQVAARARIVEQTLEDHATAARFKLKSMTRAFEAGYDIALTPLKIPTMIEL